MCALYKAGAPTCTPCRSTCMQAPPPCRPNLMHSGLHIGLLPYADLVLMQALPPHMPGSHAGPTSCWPNPHAGSIPYQPAPCRAPPLCRPLLHAGPTLSQDPSPMQGMRPGPSPCRPFSMQAHTHVVPPPCRASLHRSHHCGCVNVDCDVQGHRSRHCDVAVCRLHCMSTMHPCTSTMHPSMPGCCCA